MNAYSRCSTGIWVGVRLVNPKTGVPIGKVGTLHLDDGRLQQPAVEEFRRLGIVVEFPKNLPGDKPKRPSSSPEKGKAKGKRVLKKFKKKKS
jgi:hypothetical protein